MPTSVPVKRAMGSREGKRRSDARRPWACCVVAAVAVASLFSVAFPSAPRVDVSVSSRHFGRCPATRAADVVRRGVVIEGGRPVVSGAPCADALGAVDAGYCFGGGHRGSSRGSYRCLPSFVVGGAQKAATGWLRQWLARHPQLAQGGGKEVHYFDRLDAGALRPTWAGRYLDEFAVASLAEYTYEKTPDYLPNATAMGSLFALLPSAKLVFMLRDPSSRAYSAYQHHCRKGRFFAPRGGGAPLFSLEAPARAVADAAQLAAPCAAADFHAFLAPRGAAALENVTTRVGSWGLYADQLAAVRAAGFPDENLLVILSETALRDSATTLAFVVDWLGLDAFDFSALATYRDALGVERLRDPGLLGAARAFYAQHNTLMVRRHTAEPIDPKTRKLLDAYYKRHNHALAVLLLKTAPAVAVYPPRVVGTPFLPENWS